MEEGASDKKKKKASKAVSDGFNFKRKDKIYFKFQVPLRENFSDRSRFQK